MTHHRLDHCSLICVLSPLNALTLRLTLPGVDRPWCKHASCKHTRGQNCELPLLYLQIPEGVILCPCISFSLPSTVYLGAHFHATSAKPINVNRGDVRNRLQQGISSTSVSKQPVPCLMWHVESETTTPDAV